jgi:branched-chain amino acid transport system permease protein
VIKGVKSVKSASYIALILLLFLIPLFVKDAYYIHILIMVGINVILASSLRTISTTGQFSLAHAGFMAIGAYTSALLVMRLGLSFWVALPLAGIAAALLALIVGYPFVRVRRVYFAMLTLFAGEVIRLVIVQWKGLTGGSTGLTGVPPPNPVVIPGLLNITFTAKVPYYYLILILVLITLLFFYRIERTRIGAIFMAIQQGDSIAESVGINTAGYKVLALCIGCFFAGIAGSFYAHYILVVSPTSFTVLQTIYMLVYITVGGRRGFFGAALGAVVLTILPEAFRVLQEYQPMIFAVILVVIIFYLPEGLISLPRAVRSKMAKPSKGSLTNA